MESRVTSPPSFTCGLTFSMMPMSLYSTTCWGATPTAPVGLRRHNRHRLPDLDTCFAIIRYEDVGGGQNPAP